MYFPLDLGLRRFDRSLRADITPPELTSYGLKLRNIVQCKILLAGEGLRGKSLPERAVNTWSSEFW
jgi:hypothetical protein